MVAAVDPGNPGPERPGGGGRDDPDGTGLDGTGLDGIGKRIDALRQARKPPPPRREGKFTGASQAWRMVLELVIGMMLGLGAGWGLDAVFGTLPIFLVVFSMLGFAAGVRTMLRTAEEVRRKSAEPDAGGRDESGRDPAHRD